MFNIKEIRLTEENLIEARVEPWAPNERSFNILVNTLKRTVICSNIEEDSDEVLMYANKARNELCKLFELSKQSNQPIPAYSHVATH